LSIREADLRGLNVVAQPVEFIATQLTKNVILKVNKREKRPEIETSTSNIFGVIFVLITAFVCFNTNYSKDLLLSVVDRLRSIAMNRASSPDSQDKRRKAKKN
jgi:ABC-type lipoprotein release transport system permease subunit